MLNKMKEEVKIALSKIGGLRRRSLIDLLTVGKDKKKFKSKHFKINKTLLTRLCEVSDQIQDKI